MRISKILLGTTSLASLVAAGGGALAQEAAPGVVQTTDTIVVVGQNVYRDRTPDINPTLSYDLDFFQQFEPGTVGEMLKRTPGVVFSGDVLEYDAVQLRGLGAEYTEVLINGRRIPGQSSDGTFFVDRIPAELIESIEIIRSPSADVSSDGVAGVLNVILKDGEELEGSLFRAGATYYGDDDDAVRGSLAAALANAGDNYDFWLGFNAQQRRNPKEKLELYYDDADGVLTGYAFEDDTRDGIDYSLNGSIGLHAGAAEFRINAYGVLTDRNEQEYVLTYEGDDVGAGDLEEVSTQVEDINQTSYGVEGVYINQVGIDDEIEVSVGMSVFDEDTDTLEAEYDWGDEPEPEAGELTINDKTYSLRAAYTTTFGEAFEIKFGADARSSERDGTQDSRIALVDLEADISEVRLAPFAVAELELMNGLSLEGGLRHDHFERDITTEDGASNQKGDELLPSFSARYDLTDADRFRFSVARTLRMPEFQLLTPFEEEGAPNDEDMIVGNPGLDAEKAWGVDAGYERRVMGGGMIGVNLFYREISDLIELTNTLEPIQIEDDGELLDPGFIYTPTNIGDGKAYGVEFDVSMPLTFIGLPETGFYANYAWLDSEVADPFTGEERRFRDQPEYVYNVSMSQNFPALGAAAGFSYQQRGESLATEFEEYVILEYDANLELFVEKRLWNSTVIRASGNNLLDAIKTESIYDFGEGVNEVQIEQSSPTFTITLRTAF